jgi:hypothetical protein
MNQTQTPVMTTRLVVDQYQIVQSLKKSLPCGDASDFEDFASKLCDGQPAETLDKILLNIYIDTPLPISVVK